MPLHHTPPPASLIFQIPSSEGGNLNYFPLLKRGSGEVLNYGSHAYQLKPQSAGLARKKKAGAWSPLALFYQRRVVSYRWSKNNILASLCLASYLAQTCQVSRNSRESHAFKIKLTLIRSNVKISGKFLNSYIFPFFLSFSMLIHADLPSIVFTSQHSLFSLRHFTAFLNPPSFKSLYFIRLP